MILLAFSITLYITYLSSKLMTSLNNLTSTLWFILHLLSLTERLENYLIRFAQVLYKHLHFIKILIQTGAIKNKKDQNLLLMQIYFV